MSTSLLDRCVNSSFAAGATGPTVTAPITMMRPASQFIRMLRIIQFHMRRFAALAAFLILLSASPRLAEDARIVEVQGEGAKFWPRWRGPSGQGFVAPGKYANTWSPTSNIKWRVAVAGQGNSSPIVWGDRIFLTTSYESGARL